MALLSPQQVADKYGFSASQIRRLVVKGIIKAEKVGSYYVIDDQNLETLKRRRSLNGQCKDKMEIKKCNAGE